MLSIAGVLSHVEPCSLLLTQMLFVQMTPMTIKGVLNPAGLQRSNPEPPQWKLRVAKHTVKPVVLVLLVLLVHWRQHFGGFRSGVTKLSDLKVGPPRLFSVIMSTTYVYQCKKIIVCRSCGRLSPRTKTSPGNCHLSRKQGTFEFQAREIILTHGLITTMLALSC